MSNNYGSSTGITTVEVEKFHRDRTSTNNNLTNSTTPEQSGNSNNNKLNYNDYDYEYEQQEQLKTNSLFTPPSSNRSNSNANSTSKSPANKCLSTTGTTENELMFDVTATAPATTNSYSFQPNLISSSPAAGIGNCTEKMPASSSPHFLTNTQDRNTIPNNLLTISPINHSKLPVFTIGDELTSSESAAGMRGTNTNTGILLSPLQLEQLQAYQDVNHNKMDGHKYNHGSSSSPITGHNNLVTGTEESFECYADGSHSFFDSNSENTSLQYSRDDSISNHDLSVPEFFGGPNNNANNSSSNCTTSSGVSSLPPFKRNAVFRTSLRRSSPQNNTADMGHRRWGSFRNPSGIKRSFQPSTITNNNGTTGGQIGIGTSSTNSIGNQLYRSSSFHSSGRSSAGDGEEMYSDGSLEDEVIDLKQTVHHLEEKFNVLSENQTEVDDRYTRSKQENIELSTKLFMLEEQLRDVEQRSDERIREEQKRSKESLQRLDREKQLQIENYEIRLHSLEKELEAQKSEYQRAKQSLERERSERIQITDKLHETERELGNARDDNRKLMESARSEREALALETIGSQQALLDLKKEVENLRKFQIMNNKNFGHQNNNLRSKELAENHDHDGDSRLTELEVENRRLKSKIRELEETNEDLTAQILNHGLEEGRNLLTMNHFGGGSGCGNGGLGNSIAAEFEAMSQDEVKRALKEQKEVNEQLKAYIDGILLNIVENYPQLLEVKNKCSSASSSPGNVNGMLCLDPNEVIGKNSVSA